MAFEDDFWLLTGNSPFPWQRALYERFVASDPPKICDLPTGLGKTSVIALWLLALARNSELPRRLVYVVNRRTVVDQSTAEAEHLRSQLLRPDARHLRERLDAMAAVPAIHPITLSTLRGEFADNGAWRRDPSRPAIIVGTVDMIGSRLLFNGYGCGFRSRPLHAGFLGQDAMVVHDEAHLEPAFQSLLTAIAAEQQRSNEPRPLSVLALSATSRVEADFTLSDNDLHDRIVNRRLHAVKRLQLHIVDDRRELPERISAKAAQLRGKVIVFLSSVDNAERCAQTLRKTNRNAVATLTGTMRGAERDDLVNDPVFARFLPRPSERVKPRDGTVFLVATSAGEVGIDISADHLVSDLPPFDALSQRLGRVNRYGESDAEVHIFADRPTAPQAQDGKNKDVDGVRDESGGRGDEYQHARFFTTALLDRLPRGKDGRYDASPVALRTLPRDACAKASTPMPEVHHVDGMLFDRWSYTSIPDPLPGRPPVTEWLRGKAEWEPSRTTVAWRREVAWLTQEHLGQETLDDFLADYPLRSREMLTDITSRVLKNLQRMATRTCKSSQLVWIVRHDRPAFIIELALLLDQYDAKTNPLIDDATVILAPEAGGLSLGLLNGAAEFSSTIRYDLGCMDNDRIVHEFEGEVEAPIGMRLVRSLKRTTAHEDVLAWWRLYAKSDLADDDGSRNSRRELLLDVHLQRTEAWAARLAERLALPEAEQNALARAGRAHDLGKQRRVWQRSIKRFEGAPLAKGPMQPAVLGHYRHELGSLHDGDFAGLAAEAKDLALHVVAAHHGRARPHFSLIESYDPELKDEVVAALVHEVPLRFDRLQRRYGRWGLAWLESILRAADALGSEDDEVAK